MRDFSMMIKMMFYLILFTGTTSGMAQTTNLDTKGYVGIPYEYVPANFAKDALFQQDFEGAFPPEGWQLINADGDDYDWAQSTGSWPEPHTGDKCAYSESYHSGLHLTPDNYMITSQITLGDQNAALEFWVAAGHASFAAEKYSVMISTTGTEIEDFTAVYTETLENDAWKKVSVSLGDYLGQSIYIALRHFETTNQLLMRVDDMVIKEVAGAPGAAVNPSPADATVDLWTPVTLTWEAEDATEYDLYFGTTLPDVPTTTLSSASYTPDVAPFTTYQWKVVPKNSMGSAVNCPVWSFSTHFFTEGFENGEIPVGYTVIDNDNDGNSWNVHNGIVFEGDFALQMNSNAAGNDDWMVTPKLNPQENNHFFSFWTRGGNPEFPDKYEVKLSTTGKEVDDFTIQLQDIATPGYSYERMCFDLTDYINQEVYVAIHYTGNEGMSMYIDEMVCPVAFAEHDLALVNFDGEVLPKVNTPGEYMATVRNLGAESENDFFVKLMHKVENGDDVILDTDTVTTPLPSMEEMLITLEYNFPEIGPAQLYTIVELEGDVNDLNNSSRVLNVYPQAESAFIQNIVDGVEKIELPLKTENKSSVSEVIYFADEMNFGGKIEGLAWEYSFLGAVEDVQIRIWLGETEKDSLTEGWITSDQLTKVFEGSVSFDKGHGMAYVDFDQSFMYYGTNLVVMTERVLTSNTSNYGNCFLGASTIVDHPKRALLYYGDDAVNTTTLTMEGYIYSNRPNTRFIADISNLGHLKGMALNETALGLVGSKITIHNEEYDFSTKTNQWGMFDLPYVQAGNYTVSAISYGYYDYSVSDIVVEAGQTKAQYCYQTLLPLDTLTGTVVETGSNLPLAGVRVRLSGYNDYEVFTNELGQYSIADVYGDKEYEVKIYKKGYDLFEVVQAFTTTNEELNVQLNPVPYPGFGLRAECDYDKAQLAWYNPNYGYSKDWIMDDNSFELVLNAKLNAELSLGNAFALNDAGFLTGIDLFGVKYSEASADEQVVLDVYDMNMSKVATSEPVTIPCNEWTTVNIDRLMLNGSYFFVFVHWVNQTGYTNSLGIDLNNPSGEFYGFILNSENQPVALKNVIGGNGGTVLMRAHGMEYDDLSNKQNTVDFQPALVKSSRNGEVAMKNCLIMQQLNGMAGKAPVAVHNMKNDKGVASYKLFMGQAGDESNVASWSVVTDNVTDTCYVDNAWKDYADGYLRYALQTVYADNQISEHVFSPVLPHSINATVTMTVTTNEVGENNVEGAQLLLNNEDNIHYYEAIVPSDGAVIFEHVWQGNYTLTIEQPGFENYEALDIVVDAETEQVTAELIETIEMAYNLEVDTTSMQNGNTDFSWNNIYAPLQDNFESYEDFTLAFEPWTMVDVDKAYTYGIEGAEWPNMCEKQAFMIFNNTATTPPMNFGQAHSGTRIAACFGADGAQNDDWMIADQIKCGEKTVLEFFARAVDPVYNQEKFNVGVSVTGTEPDDFELITETITADPTAWKKYTIDLSAYAGKQIYVGIHCISNDQFMFMVDDVFIGQPVNNAAESFTEYEVFLDGNSLGKTSDKSIQLTGLEDNKTYTVGVKSIYSSGVSPLKELSFIYKEFVGIESFNGMEVKVYPVPSRDIMTIENAAGADVNIWSVTGQLFYSSRVNSDVYSMNVSELPVGTYMMQMTKDHKVINRMISVIK